MSGRIVWREEAISRHHDRKNFDCGSQELNEYLRRYAHHQYVAVGKQPSEQLDVFGITANECVARVGIVAPSYLAILREVVDSDNLMTRAQEVFDEIAHDEARRSG